MRDNKAKNTAKQGFRAIKNLEATEASRFFLVRGTGLEPTKRRFDLPLSVPISTITWESNANFLPSHVGKFYLISTQ